MEVLPLAYTAAAEVVTALFSGCICRFGVPAFITSNRGAQFTSNIWNSLCLLFQIKHQPTTACHPQAKKMVERLHRCLKDALRAQGTTSTWATELPWVLLGAFGKPQERTPTSLQLGLCMAHHSLVLLNQYLSINNEQTMNEFIIQIDKKKSSYAQAQHAPLQARSCQRTCPRICGHGTHLGQGAAATCRPSRPSNMTPTQSCSAASATSGSRWATGRTTSPPLTSSPAPAAPQSPQRCHPGSAGPGGICPPPPKRDRFNLAHTTSDS
jgi:hypothetical protein